MNNLLSRSVFFHLAVISAALYVLMGFCNLFVNNGKIESEFYFSTYFNTISDGFGHVHDLGDFAVLGIGFFVLAVKLLIRVLLSALPVLIPLRIILKPKPNIKQQFVYSFIALCGANMLLLLGRNVFYLLPIDLITTGAYLIVLHYEDQRPLSPAIAFAGLVVTTSLLVNAGHVPFAFDGNGSNFNLGLIIKYFSFWSLMTSTFLLVKRETGSKPLSFSFTDAHSASKITPTSSPTLRQDSQPVDVEAVVRQLKELKGLLDEGLLTPEEYDTYKQKILGDNHE